MKFSSRTDWSTEDNELSRAAALLRQDNIPILDLTVSNPTKCGFQYLKADLLQTLTDSKNLNYDPDPRGLASAREIICRYYERRGIRVTPDRVFITAGTSEAYSFIFKLLFETGDFLLAPQPSYPLLDYLASLHDIGIKRYALSPQKNWEINLAGHYELKETDPKAVLIVNPNNPTGNYLHAPELAELNIFCKNRNTAIISDEVFFDFPLTENRPASAVSCAGNRHSLAFTLSGISKILGLPQMKFSWIVVSGPEELAKEAVKRLEVISDTYLSASTPAQNAAAAWFSNESIIQAEILQRIRNNYLTLQNHFGQGGAVRLFPVQAGWHAPLQLPSRHTDEEWACMLLEKTRALAHPGYLFDFSEGSFLVLSLIIPENQFREGVEKIKSVASGPS